MTAEAQRIAIATAAGWEVNQEGNWLDQHIRMPNGSVIRRADPRVRLVDLLPDYLNSLDAMHEAEKVLTPSQIDKYDLWLMENCGPWSTAAIHATAAQRAEAFLRTLGLWKEESK